MADGFLHNAGADRVFERMADFWPQASGRVRWPRLTSEKSRLDEAARAGWLYFIAGHTQDEIAKMLQVSRASAQRLVSLCLAERLITFRLEHPIAACMELAARLKDLFHLAYCEVVPTDPAAPLAAAGIAERAANILELMLRSEKPTIVALGTGRAVRAAVERVSPIDRPNHQIVSLVGNISADGSASFFDTVGRLADIDAGAPLSDAAAVPDVVGERTQPDAADRSDREGAGGRGQSRSCGWSELGRWTRARKFMSTASSRARNCST